MGIKLKIAQTLAHGYSSNSTQQELLYEYQHDSVLYGFQTVAVPLAKVALASQGLTHSALVAHMVG